MGYGRFLPPIDVLLSWPLPNYIDPPDRYPCLFILSIILCSISTIVIALRAYSRIVITKSLGLDDAFTFASYVLATTMCGLVANGEKNFHWGRHVWDIPRDTAQSASFHNWLSELLYVVSISAIKISVLLFYRRVTMRSSKIYVNFVKAGIVYNVLYAVTFVTLGFTECQPLEAYWMRMDGYWGFSHKMKCMDGTITLPLAGVFSLIGDIYSFIIPYFAIAKMQLAPRQRRILYILFSMGSIVILLGAIRVGLLYYLIYGSWDWTWHALWPSWLLTVIESNFAIYVASLPALKPFFSSAWHSSLASRGRSSAKGLNSSGHSGRTKESRAATPNDQIKFGKSEDITVLTEFTVTGTERGESVDQGYSDIESTRGLKSRDESTQRHNRFESIERLRMYGIQSPTWLYRNSSPA